MPFEYKTSGVESAKHVRPVMPRVSTRHKYHFEHDPMETGPGWKFRPGINARQLFSDFEGYRVTLMRFSEGSAEPEGMQSGASLL